MHRVDSMTATTSSAATPSAAAGYTAWMRARQLQAHRHAAVIAQRRAQADQSEGADVHGQDLAWAQRHAQERRLHESAIAHLRHG